MEKDHIIAEIRRTAAENGGKPLGTARFEAATGISISDWFGKYWAKWGDAITEAGYPPNSLQAAYDDEWLIEQMIEFVREIGRYPSSGEIRLRTRNHETFPSHNVFHRIGRKAEIAAKIVEYCNAREGFDDVLSICGPLTKKTQPKSGAKIADYTEFGYVYLMKSGRHYKIGRSNSAGRREYELAIQMPERLTTIHTISTDDPLGIEAYWHRRFKSKRLNGEWFNLDASDIRAFKRRKFM